MMIGRMAQAALLAGAMPVAMVGGGVAWAAAAVTAPTGLDVNGHPNAVPTLPSGAFGHVRLQNGVQLRVNGVVKTILFYGPATVRINSNTGRNHWTARSLVVLPRPADVPFTVTEAAGTLTIATARLRLSVDKRSGATSFFDAGGKLFTREDAAQPQTVKPVTIADAPSYEAENRFTLRPDEAIYGFGFTDDATINRRGTALDLVQTNIGIIIPVMVSSRRYGVLWDSYSHMRFADDARGTRLWAESAPGGVDYYFMGADTMDGVIQSYRALTGAAPMVPKQAFGLFMSKERYPTQDRLLEVAETFRRERFPLDYIVQDWQYWGGNDGSWSGMTWDKTRFADPERTIKRIHDLNLKLMVSIWPSVGNDTALGKELDQHGLRFAPLHWISKQARIYDAFSPLGRQIYFKHAKAGLLDKGVDALWMDGTEVEVSTAMHDAKAAVTDIKSLGRNTLGNFSRYLNVYSLMTTQGTYDGQRASSDKRVLTLTRSAWAGAQRTAAASWSGDTLASWKTLRHQVAGGVNVTVTGNPYWTQDTGGFFVGGYGGGHRNPIYRELFARWFQYAAFNPLMRVHGTDIEREPYLFKTLDPQVYASLLGAVNLRYRMLPYIYANGWQVTANGYTLMRPLAMDFPDDARVHSVNDAFMFGGALLVHPVTRAMYRPEPEPATTVPASALTTPDGQPGLAGTYFADTAFEKPVGKVIDATIDKRWPAPPLEAMPPGLTRLDDFSARWEGMLEAPEDGDYELGLQGDDGVRLYVDGRKLIEDWASGRSRYSSAKVTLRKGQRVPVRIEYYQGTGERDLRFAWRRPAELRAAAAKASGGPDLSVRTYLPAGGWYDFWTNERLSGGRDVARNVPLDIVPLYVRAGAILPLGPLQQYATEKPDAAYEIRVYPGANGAFTLYEDDNETYAYERGARATYTLDWNDARRTLTIGGRQGSFPGMTATRQLKLVLVRPGTPGGTADMPATRTVTYTGQPMTVRF
ncbi:glycoside hydrolase [Sphingomonas sp. Leaf11]|nr:glycoside hydrolase [Sphingomonas sp. Leaf9]KQM43749.1 glycoside hydrolase [Sphingomonas sp. Leaf11]